MIDLTTYALLRKQITSAVSGVSDVRAEGDELVFVLEDGREVRVAIPATEIRDAVVRDDVLVLTLEDDKEVVVDATLTQSGQAADAKVTGDVVSQLNDDIGDFTADYEIQRTLTDADYTVNNGYFMKYNGVVGQSALWDYYVIPVSVGEKYTITTTANQDVVAWIERSSGQNILRIANRTPSQTEITDTIVISDGAAELVVNHRASVGTPTIIEKTESEKHISDAEAERIIKNTVKVDDAFFRVLVYPARTEFLDYENHNSKFLKRDGTEADAVNTYNVAVCTDISAGDKLLIRGNGSYEQARYAFYDANEDVLSVVGGKGSSISIFDEIATVPEKATTLKVCWNDSNSFTVGAVIERVISYKSDDHGWKGLKWVCLGDSLTAVNSASNKHYFDYVADRTGIIPINMGAGGTGYWRGGSGAFYVRANDIPECDIVTIFGSGNDLADNSVLGDFDSTDVSTVAGCVNKTLDIIFEKYPAIPVGMVSPTPWGNRPTTMVGNLLKQYTELLKKIAEYRGVPFLDLYHHSGLRPEDDKQNSIYYSAEVIDGYTDRVHPNNAGQKFLYPHFLRFIETLIS